MSKNCEIDGNFPCSEFFVLEHHKSTGSSKILILILFFFAVF